MRINIVSDLHDDIRGNRISAMPPVDADVTVVAGDAMAPGTLALRRIRELYPDTSRPLVYVAGNHDFYSEPNDKLVAREPQLRTTYEYQREQMPVVADELGIVLLDDSAVTIDDVRFVGGTLWTDFSARPGHVMFGDAVRADRLPRTQSIASSPAAGLDELVIIHAARRGAHGVSEHDVARACGEIRPQRSADET
ncbi:MAG: metallophosphoesterase family protein, partial [Rhizobiales bacterium]|nr:metallophosphoesterase family protein [Hyphomicrobiales bacterium]